jgi:Rrf2 family protein
MSLCPRKGVLAIAAVVDIAMNARGRLVTAKALTARQRLPPRHIEPVLQELVHHGVLKGVRGSAGGYELARDQRRITAADILRAANSAEEELNSAPLHGSTLVRQVIMPALARAETAFDEALALITVEELVRSAKTVLGSKH